jgi:GNAT superfamily N-acetyltransferase
LNKSEQAINRKDITYRSMSEQDFKAVIKLGTLVHGEGYIDDDNIKKWYAKGVSVAANANYVAYHQEQLVGFRLTFAPNSWQIDQWCTPELWNEVTDNVCYFKCNTVDEHYRSLGIGSALLKLSIEAARLQGATAGVSHLWKQSPKNSAVKYFTRCGGKLVKEHPDRWAELSKNGYECPICAFDCKCEAAEMIIHFD